MASILENFVKVNIGRHVGGTTVSEYNTAIYVVSTLTAGYYSRYGSGTGDGTSKANAKAAYTAGAWQSSDLHLKYFFENGGQFLHVIAPTDFTKDKIEDGTIPMEEIVVFKAAGTSPTYWPGQDSFEATTGVFQKIYVLSTNSTTKADPQGSGIAKKYVPSGTYATAAAAAYYTQMDIYEGDSAKDYAFTAETVPDTEITATPAAVTACITNDLNCDVKLAGRVRNVGGNATDGEALTNTYMRIVLQQQIHNALLDLLATKLKYDDRGVAQVKSVLIDVMLRFINNGYITKGKVWDDVDLYIRGDKVIARNTPLTAGYIIHVAPFASLTPTDRQNHKFPEITIIYGDAIAIRAINVSGEVF